MSLIKRGIRKVARSISLTYRYGQFTFSQEGEELVLSRLTSNKTDGFYVDIGCHHPMRFSNTYSFYKKGWRGINIDANVDTIAAFNRMRKKDINILCGVGAETGEKLRYYRFNDGAINTFDEKRAKELIENSDYKCIDVQEVEIKPLRELLEMYLPKNQKIDFMDIDVEGLDLQVVQSNDWKRFRPTYLLVEANSKMSMSEIEKLEMSLYLQSVGYELYGRFYNTLLWRNQWLDRYE